MILPVLIPMRQIRVVEVHAGEVSVLAMTDTDAMSYLLAKTESRIQDLARAVNLRRLEIHNCRLEYMASEQERLVEAFLKTEERRAKSEERNSEERRAST